MKSSFRTTRKRTHLHKCRNACIENKSTTSTIHNYSFSYANTAVDLQKTRLLLVDYSKDINRKIRTTFFIDFVFEFWFQIPSKTCTVPFSSVNCAACGTFFGTTDIYELGFSYHYISIFRLLQGQNSLCCILFYVSMQ